MNGGDLKTVVAEACRAVGGDRSRLMDVALTVQERCGWISSEAVDLIAAQLGLPRVEVDGLATFYSFLSRRPKGKVVIRLCNDVVDRLLGADKVAEALEQEAGVKFGQTTPDGLISLEHTACLGMSDQAPAALVNSTVVTNLDPGKAQRLVQTIRRQGPGAKLVTTLGDGRNAHDLVRAMVVNNLRQRGPVIFEPYEPGCGLRKALAMTPAEVVREVKTSRLRGRGGAGFPTGMKWDFTRQAGGPPRYVLGNADEGEPGTFKDRVILTECPELMFEGMTIAGYAAGAESGILYLRGEYVYLQALLEHALSERRKQGLLGRRICGKPDFNFEIRIQLGAGAYICGEETALISSCEGRRGDPKNRPPFPAQKGYLDAPTVVNNVETLCCVARILDKGAGWFAQSGSRESAGAKLLSVAGDCSRPGVYEVPFGIKLSEVLKLCGAEAASAVQVGGPSGTLVGKAAFGRAICYEDLATGGAITVFGAKRNVVEIAKAYLEFFVEESCGYCTPCRVGNVLLEKKLETLLAGRGEPEDLDYLERLARTVKLASRCGLGQTSPNPVLGLLEHFKPACEALMRKKKSPEVLASFDLSAALKDGEALADRKPEAGGRRKEA